jgi:hypothetical protein
LGVDRLKVALASGRFGDARRRPAQVLCHIVATRQQRELRRPFVSKSRHRFERIERVQSALKAPSVKEFFVSAGSAVVTVMRQSHRRWKEATTTENSGIDAGTGDDNRELVVVVRNDTARG